MGMDDEIMRNSLFVDDRVGTPASYKCPITGGALIYDGYEHGTLDGDSYYHSELDPSLKWEKNMRSFYWELIHEEERWMSWKEKTEARRYFKVDDNGEWVEYFAKISTPTTRLFPVGTSMIDVDNILQLDIEAKKLRDEEYQRKVDSGEIDPFAFGVAVRVQAKTISQDIVSVQPMSAPLGISMYIDYTTQIGPNKPDYPYNVTVENIEIVRRNWKDQDLQVGDQITQWDKGGWTSLSGRAGEHIRRKGKIIASRLTRMS